MNNFMQLDEMGVVSSPEGILEAIIQRFRKTDAYQSKLFPVASLEGLLAQYMGRDTELKEAINDKLSAVIDAYFPEGHTLSVELVAADEGHHVLTLSITVSTSKGSVDGAWAMNVVDGKVRSEGIYSSNKVSYEL